MDIRKQRTWAEISTGAIIKNMALLRGMTRPGVRFLGVVKADAYGHGAIPVARALEENGCDHLAVATVPEGAELREAGVRLPILVLGCTPAFYAEELIRYDLTQAISELDTARAFSEAALRLHSALHVHLKLDTGMGRTGFDCRNGRDPMAELLTVFSLPGLSIDGAFTHFAVSENDPAYTRAQASDFLRIAKCLSDSGHPVPLLHCSNSGATLQYPEYHLDMIRPGILLYGILPEDGMADPGLTPAMTLKTRIWQIRSLRSGDSVGYGRRYIADGNRKIAVLPVGYADGLHRFLSCKAEFLLRGKRIRQVGGICMDMCMADVTDVPEAEVGDEVTIFGPGLSVSEQAEKAGTVSYELLCSVSPRVPRVYI